MCEFCGTHPGLVTITLLDGNKRIVAERGANLLELLQKNGAQVPAVCGGRGTCGKCRVLVDGEAVLACKTTVHKDISVALCGTDDGFTILDSYTMTAWDGTQTGFAIAVDIGTTTVVLQLIDAAAGKVVGSTSFVNAQRQFGADVISRIKAADEGQLTRLSQLITGAVLEAVKSLCATAGVSYGDMRKLMITGNTTMMYLLLGLSCRSLGQFPFTPEFAWQERYGFEEIFHDALLDCPVELVPWISAFVGGDITSGLLHCGSGGENRFLLIDIGTNGEMALQVGSDILCTSTAAGPAFEGGNISCGMGGVRGAICAVDYRDGAFVYATIGGVPPVGICGSGVLDIGACLLEHGYVDDSGLLEDEWFDDGVQIACTADGTPIVFTQKDIRELQLAKSAIRAGIEILIAEQGGGYGAIDKVYLSGGFSQNMRVRSAVAIGMIPAELGEKIVACGNSALGGCVRLCASPGEQPRIRAILDSAREINLSNHPQFNDLFMDHMLFP